MTAVSTPHSSQSSSARRTSPHYRRARGYNPTTGYFTTRDPLGFAGGDANLYRYCANNPVTYVDPSGLQVAVPGPDKPKPKPDGKNKLDESKYPEDRKEIDKSRDEYYFPYLRPYEIVRPRSNAYNCWAYILGITDERPSPGKSTDPHDFSAEDERLIQKGYTQSKDLNTKKEEGVQKVVIYGFDENGRTRYTHGAIQQEDGTWKSKMGDKGPLIRYEDPSMLDGPSYGKPVRVYRRPLEKTSSSEFELMYYLLVEWA
jgi:RHS repeat-associated protein